MIGSQDVYDAYAKYRALKNLPYNHNSKMLFIRFLFSGTGKQIPKSTILGDIADWHPKAQERINWINGPNAETMLKIWQAQNPGLQ